MKKFFVANNKGITPSPFQKRKNEANVNKKPG